ncbi:hypothetical protein HQO42_14975 [Rhodococcus fascians]|nr:hypothetical protein [Rhodococcus fascians]MBY4237757.1 hypothetical protein [Rhodococcus fascians]MBY4253960.1 hypothetical protein [Rhodococcus fascians]MBY4269169.1 hypothetical protein [Rhodococcus fascians]
MIDYHTATDDEIDDAVDAWHDLPAHVRGLAEYLGWTESQYAEWVESPQARLQAQ